VADAAVPSPILLASIKINPTEVVFKRSLVPAKEISIDDAIHR